jgi:hypothetical protein
MENIMEVKVNLDACEHSLKKESVELQNELSKAANNLGKKITEYHDSGIDFIHICNAENVKYDKHGEFYTYKHHGKNKSQLRLLYACIQNEDMTEIIIADYIEKRKNVCKGHKDHLDKFSKYDKQSLESFCKNNGVVL